MHPRGEAFSSPHSGSPFQGLHLLLRCRRNGDSVYLSRSDASRNSSRPSLPFYSITLCLSLTLPLWLGKNSAQITFLMPLFCIKLSLQPKFFILPVRSLAFHRSALCCRGSQWMLLRQTCHCTAGWSDTHQYVSTTLAPIIRGGETQIGVDVMSEESQRGK